MLPPKPKDLKGMEIVGTGRRLKPYGHQGDETGSAWMTQLTPSNGNVWVPNGAQVASYRLQHPLMSAQVASRDMVLS